MTSTELVWDHGGTATAASGAYLLPAGTGTAWEAPLLLATAAGASLLATFIALARDAQVPVLGYVAQQRPQLATASDGIAAICITACISVPSEKAADRARTIWTLATRCAPALRVLKCPVVCESSIVVLSDEAIECHES
jgi:hypothetical protein